MTSSTPSPGPLGPAARLPYDDLARISDMGADCEAAGRALRLPVGREATAAAFEDAGLPPGAEQMKTVLRYHIWSIWGTAF